MPRRMYVGAAAGPDRYGAQIGTEFAAERIPAARPEW